MMDALYSGMTGLNGFQSALNTQSNNIANVSTVAYKADNISFADQMYQNAIGKGVSIATVNKNYAQGSTKVTNGTYDMAVNGKGFFIVKGSTAEPSYTRAGNFLMAEDGTLRLPSGEQVQGIPATSSVVLSTEANSIFSTSSSKMLGSQVIKKKGDNIVETINSKATDYTTTSANDLDTLKGSGYKLKDTKIADIDALSTLYRSELNLYSTSPIVGTTATKQVSDMTFDKTKLTNSLDSVEITIGANTYRQAFRNDALTTLQDFADTISQGKALTASVDATGKLTVTSMLPGQKVSITGAQIVNGANPSYPLPVISTTDAIVGSGKARLDTIELALKDAVEKAGGKYLKMSTIVDATDLATKTMSELQMKLDTLKISQSPFGTAEIDNGLIYIKQGDNRFVIGKVVTAVFSNEEGLTAKGNNLYSATKDSQATSF
ncbi:MAG: flagellar hook-basal body complex protein [Arcobacter sp.]|nr:flagellar hook-basal body complex protein [Arcobacter sp.]